MFKILDRYIIKKFLSTFFLSIVLINGIAIVFDLSEHISNFLDNHLSFGFVISHYYMNFVPYYTNLFLFLFVFITVIFVTSKMAGNSEFISMLASGISFFRILRPYMFSALVVAILSFVLGNFIIPPANKERIAFENKYFYHHSPYMARNVHKQVSPGVFLYIQYYDAKKNMANTFSLEEFQGNRMKKKLMAKYARWDTTKNTWTIYSYWERTYLPERDIMKLGEKKDTVINITPKEIIKHDVDITTLNFFQLNDFIDQEKLHGSENINQYLLERYKRTAYPFSTFILTFIGVAISSKKIRGGTGLNIGIGLILSFAYIFFMQVADQFSIKGDMSPLLAVWIPNIFFTIVAAISYRWAPK